MLPDLLSQIPKDQEIGSVTADGAYDTRKCHDAIADRGAHVVIPPRKNAKPWKSVTAGAVVRNEALRASKHLDRAIWRTWSGYHRRSRVETKMHCVTLLGQRFMARGLHLTNEAGVPPAIFGPPFVDSGAAHAMFATQLGYRHAVLHLPQDIHDLGFSESCLLHRNLFVHSAEKTLLPHPLKIGGITFKIRDRAAPARFFGPK